MLRTRSSGSSEAAWHGGDVGDVGDGGGSYGSESEAAAYGGDGGDGGDGDTRPAFAGQSVEGGQAQRPGGGPPEAWEQADLATLAALAGMAGLHQDLAGLAGLAAFAAFPGMAFAGDGDDGGDGADGGDGDDGDDGDDGIDWDDGDDWDEAGGGDEFWARAAERQAQRRRHGLFPPGRQLRRFQDGPHEGPGGGYGDDQNVHDHGVAAGIRAAVAEIRAALRDGPGEPSAPDEVAAEIESVVDHTLSLIDGTGSTVAEAMAMIDSLVDTPFEAFGGVSERRMLACVWRHIRALPPAWGDDMRGQLVRELAAGMERGMPVCSAGKFARMISVYDGRDVLVSKPKPMWAVREELARMAARTRDAAGGQEGGQEGGEAAKRGFIAEARAQYIDGLGMSPSILEPIIAEYADAM